MPDLRVVDPSCDLFEQKVMSDVVEKGTQVKIKNPGLVEVDGLQVIAAKMSLAGATSQFAIEVMFSKIMLLPSLSVVSGAFVRALRGFIQKSDQRFFFVVVVETQDGKCRSSEREKSAAGHG